MKYKFFKYSICKLLIVVMLVPMLQACEIVAAGGVAGVFAYFLGKKSAQRGDTAMKTEALVEVRKEMEDKQKAVSSTDQNIGNDINQRLVSGAVDQQLAVYPEVKNGVVILHGRVPDAKAAEKVIQSARSAPGVSRIISNLVIVNQQQAPVPYAGQAQQMQPVMPQYQQRMGGQMVTPQQYPQQVIPLQPVQQPAMPQYQQYPQQVVPQQYYQQPQQQLRPVYQQPPQPVYQQPQPQYQQQQYPQQLMQLQQPQYPPQDYANQEAEKKSLNSANAEADQKKNLRRPANQPNQYINSGYYYDQYGNAYYYPQEQLQNQVQQPALMPEEMAEKYSDNDSVYTKFNEYRKRPASQAQNFPAQNNVVQNIPNPNIHNNELNIPVPTPSITADYDEYYRPLGSYNPSGPVQYTSPAIPVPTPALPYDQDEYYRPLGAYNPNPVQPTNFQYVSPAEEPNAGALDIPIPTPSDDNDGNYYYFY